MTATLSELRQAWRDRQDQTDTHCDRYERHLAVNVKYYGAYPDAPDGVVQAAWEQCCETFWDDAREIAREHGYDNVFSEGRSGGWLVPFYQASARRSRYWQGQGGALGYPRYPDPESLTDRVKFAAFRADIEARMRHVPECLAETAADIQRTADEWPA